MRISLLGERELIKKIAAVVGGVNDREAVGIGDDAALTRISAGYWLVTAKDMLVEGVHFLLPQTAPADLGYKSLAVNPSDPGHGRPAKECLCRPGAHGNGR